MSPFGPAIVYRSYDTSCMWNLLHLANILLLRAHPALPPAAHMAAGICAQATQPYATLIGRISAGMHMPSSDDIPLSPFLGAALIESSMPLFFAGIQYQDPAQRSWTITRLIDIDRRTGWASAAAIARGCETAWEKAAEMGKGPAYGQRRTTRMGEPGPIVRDPDGADDAGRNMSGGAVRPAGASLSGTSSAQWGYIVGRDGTKHQVTWARNLLTTEEDLRVEIEKVSI